MKYRTFVILYILDKFNGERSISGVYHLLTGKKSTQTVQDGSYFGVAFLYRTLKHLTRNELQKSIQHLVKKGYIHSTTIPDHYTLTIEGKRVLATYLRHSPFPAYLNGSKYHELAQLFWGRYSLFTQCISHILDGNQQFLPITRNRDTLLWVKQKFPRSNRLVQNLAKSHYDETKTILESLTSTEASYFVLRLSSKDTIGYTHDQATSLLNLDTDRGIILFQGILHYFIEKVSLNKEAFPTLATYFHDQSNMSSLAASTRLTYQLLTKGKQIEEISRIRKLKINTIEDHLVEIAINLDYFDISPFVSLHDQKIISNMINKLDTKKLKTIKQHLNDEYSYFQIRLVMTRTMKQFER